MDVTIRDIITKKIKQYLIFFCFVFGLSCNSNTAETSVKVCYKENKAVSVEFHATSTDGQYKVFLGENSKTPVLGTLTLNDNTYNFKPIVPFSEGETYVVSKNDTPFTEFYIEKHPVKHPKLNVIYPSRDTVPENLLKMYFVFSEPMEEVGNPLDYISVRNRTDQKDETIFLDLEAQLWNAEHTELTLWLDPGRIKTDLIPNKEKGLPIIQGKEYRIRINGDWRSANGRSLRQTYEKSLYVSARDGQRPLVSQWGLTIPKVGTTNGLKIDFKESLDAMLIQETVQLSDKDGTVLEGELKLQPKEEGIFFYPKNPWQKGRYTIQIATKLEDLAGNNLNHVFDRDLDKTPSKPRDAPTEYLEFVVK